MHMEYNNLPADYVVGAAVPDCTSYYV